MFITARRAHDRERSRKNQRQRYRRRQYIKDVPRKAFAFNAEKERNEADHHEAENFRAVPKRHDLRALIIIARKFGPPGEMGNRNHRPAKITQHQQDNQMRRPRAGRRREEIVASKGGDARADGDPRFAPPETRARVIGQDADRGIGDGVEQARQKYQSADQTEPDPLLLSVKCGHIQKNRQDDGVQRNKKKRKPREQQRRKPVFVILSVLAGHAGFLAQQTTALYYSIIYYDIIFIPLRTGRPLRFSRVQAA